MKLRSRHAQARLGVALALLAGASQAAAEEPRTTNTDCGVYALFVIFQLQGCPVSLDELDRTLPPRHPEGYSMAELSRASGSLGLPLNGARFGRGDAPLKRPVIAFLRDSRAGHFAVLRPVGTTGTMVQVIDPPYAPRIVDYETLFRGKAWTGRILALDRPWSPGVVAYAICGAASLMLLTIAVTRYSRRDRGADRSPQTGIATARTTSA